LSTVDLVLVLLRIAAGVWLLWSVPRLRRSASVPPTTASVSVVVPARDEAEALPRLLASIPEQVDVVVVDDHSSDATATVARDAGARVVDSARLPDGWIGKAWACEQGADAAKGDVVVFVDADVRFDDGGFEAVVAEHGRRGGLVSVQPYHRPGRRVEHLAALFNIVGFAGTDAASPLGRIRGVRGAFGPVLATNRGDHETVGGHESVRSSIIDDVALAERYREASLPVAILCGGDLASIRMYPDGFGQLVEGFTKNLAAGVRHVRPATTALIVAWLSLLVQASVLPVRAMVGDAEPAIASCLYAVVAIQFWWMARGLGRFSPLVAATFPVSLALFFAVFVRSVVATLRGTVSWRGRRVPLR
jgi:4,4'-diaponeurosporenoate glycosyltransferase